MNIILFKQTQIEELTSTQQQVTSELSTILMQTDIETVTATSSNTKLYKLYTSTFATFNNESIINNEQLIILSITIMILLCFMLLFFCIINNKLKKRENGSINLLRKVNETTETLKMAIVKMNEATTVMNSSTHKTLTLTTAKLLTSMLREHDEYPPLLV